MIEGQSPPCQQRSVMTPPSTKNSLVAAEKGSNEEKATDVVADLLLQRRKWVLRETWRIVEAGLNVQTTMLLYQELLQQRPEIRAMFANTNMQAQAQKLYDMLRVSVRFLDHMEMLVPLLQEIGIRHATSYGVRREHYLAVNQVFVQVLKSSLEPGGSCGGCRVAATQNQQQQKPYQRMSAAEIADAWQWVLKAVSDVMADAADEEALSAGTQKISLSYSASSSNTSMSSTSALHQDRTSP